MWTEASEQSRPVKLRATRPQNVRNVRTVVTFPFHDKRLGPDQLFG